MLNKITIIYYNNIYHKLCHKIYNNDDNGNNNEKDHTFVAREPAASNANNANV